jgi:hypothetical protein
VTLTKEGREELALALLLWKDFKCDGKMDLEISRQCLEFAKHLNIVKEFDKLLPKLPPMKITERYPRR